MPLNKNDLSLRVEEVALLRYIVQNTDLGTTKWDVVGQKMQLSISAAKQRFGRLLNKLKSLDPTSSAGDGENDSTATRNVRSNGATAGGGRKRGVSNARAVGKGKRAKQSAAMEDDTLEDDELKFKPEPKDVDEEVEVKSEATLSDKD